MKTFTRIVLLVIVSGAVVLTATVAAAAVAIYGAGSIAVNVAETNRGVLDPHGDRIALRVPAGLANLALNLVPSSLVDEVLQDVLHDMGADVEPILPAVRNAWDELSKSEDFVLVEVNSGDEHVLVRKLERRLVIEVDADDAQFELAIPMRTVGKLIHKL